MVRGSLRAGPRLAPQHWASLKCCFHILGQGWPRRPRGDSEPSKPGREGTGNSLGSGVGTPELPAPRWEGALGTFYSGLGGPGQCPRPTPGLQGHDVGAWFFLSPPSAPHPRQPSFLRLQPVCQVCQPAPELSPLKMSTVPLSSSVTCPPHRCPCCRVHATAAASPRPGHSKCYHCTPTARPEAQESLLTLPVPHVLHPLCGQVLRVSPSVSLRLLGVFPPQ